MGWNKSIINEYRKKKEELLLAGGQNKIDLQHQRGKMTARERIEALFDDGKYNEIEMYRQSQVYVEEIDKKNYLGDGVICAYGRVNGEIVYAIAEDATISGGASGTTQVEKICRTLELAISVKKPFVMLCESGGARIEEGINALAAHSRLFKDNARASGYIPQIAAIMGNCAGGSAYSPAMCDFCFMVRNTGQFFITGPKVIKALTGEAVSMDELGGAKVHATLSGQAHFICENDKECIEGIKEVLEYITEREKQTDKKADYKKLAKEIESIVPENKKRPYDVREVIRRIVDEGKMLEVLPEFAQNIVTCFVRIDGKTVGVVANQPNCIGGALDCDASDKCARYIRFCDCFNIPILTLVDVPGFYPGKEQEKRGILRHGSKMLFAYGEATVPQVSLVLRKAYGGAYCAMGSKALGCDIAFAWPICEFAVMGADGAVDVMFHKLLENSSNPKEMKNRLVQQYEEKYLDPFFAATCGMIDDVIFPEDTRDRIIAAFESLKDKKIEFLQKKHENITL